MSMMRKTTFISVKYLAQKELLRYELLMQIADEKTVFRWISSDLKFASVVLLDPAIFKSREALPASCICIWISDSAVPAAKKHDMILPLSFRLPDLISVLDRAALRILDMKTEQICPGDVTDPFYHRTYRISKWTQLEHSLSAIRFQKILAIMTKQSINWHWLLAYGGLTERDAYLFLDELRKRNVLIERMKLPVSHETSRVTYADQKESGVGMFVKKINQWLGRSRLQELERTP
ncbi:Hypothetical Protein CFU_2635 [Collimonas fungivorans Ter331]|uniref:Uncharacterized protein n=2 Tax=Collimonas fungivorans TaxID=158899 RepID=G0ACA7_COLFT|nr:Hypothetical Protein CFU_2635 [Collimonas fungivorans Ter331]